MTSQLILTVAQSAAIARMPEEAARLRLLANQQPRDPYFWFEAKADVDRGFLDAYLGDPEAGWEKLEPWATDPHIFATRAYLRVAPHIQLLFGEVARFQEFINSEDE